MKKRYWKKYLLYVSKHMESDIELFETLLCSYSSRLRAVKDANGRHTDYWFYSSKLKNKSVWCYWLFQIRFSFKYFKKVFFSYWNGEKF